MTFTRTCSSVKGALWRLFLCCLVGALATPASAQEAPSFEVLQNLDFGTIAVPANDPPEKVLRVPVTGAASYDAGLIQLVPPIRGRYDLSNLPANTRVTVTSGSGNLSAGGLGLPPYFIFDDLVSNEPLTDVNGAAELVLTGSLKTSATGQAYPDAPYEGDAIVELSYFSPEAGQVVTQFETIDITVEASTGLNLTEVESLTFGTLAASSGPGGQAAMILAPNGEITVTTAPNARLTPLSGSSPATILVEGAAGFYDLTINVEAGAIELVNTSLPSAPVFEVSDFTTVPSGSGRTDQDGQLEIQVGATIRTENADVSASYPEGIYTGTYLLTVEY